MSRTLRISSSLWLPLALLACGGSPGPTDGGASRPDGGSVTDGSATDGSATDGSATDGSATDGSVTDGSVTDGSVTDGSGGDSSTADAGSVDSGAPDAGPPGASFRFLAYGDTRAGGGCEGNAVHKRLVARMVAEPDIDFVTNTGDMVTGYDSSTCFVSEGACTSPDSHGDLSRLIAPLSSRPAPAGLPSSYIPVIGNHDDSEGWYPDPCGGRICDVFDMGALTRESNPGHSVCTTGYPTFAYYSFKHHGVFFVVLRVNSDYFDLLDCAYPDDGYADCADYCKNAPPGPSRSDRCYNVHQYDWLVQQLASVEGDASIHHRVVLLHAPIYTSFDDHPATASSPALTELFDRYNVDLVLNGHNHTYERTVPIRAGREDASGTVYITTGGGGSPIYAPVGDWFTAASGGQYHYLRLEIDDRSIRGEAITVDGEVLDAF